MNWKRLSDGKEIDLKVYLENWISKNPKYKMYIGCDSHNDVNKTTYATVIVLHYQGTHGGGHVLLSRETEKKRKSRLDRLWKEVELSVETAQILINYGFPKPDYIDVDLNPDSKYKSNAILRAAVGLIESMGIEARYKTKSPWSISIADKACK